MRINYIVIYITLLLSTNVHSQNHIGSALDKSDTAYALIGDTLFSNMSFKIFIGQPVVIGKPSGERDWYNTITFKSGAAWPLVFLKKSETALDLEYQLDPSVREKDKLKEYLTPGDTLIITKIKRFGKKRLGYWYQVSMGQKQGLLSLNFKCDLINAIKSKEVLLTRNYH